MKWILIKTKKDFPKDANKEVVFVASLCGEKLGDIGNHEKLKYFLSGGWSIKWLDEDEKIFASQIEQLKNFIINQKEATLVEYVKVPETDEEGKTMYATENIVCSLILNEIDKIFWTIKKL